MSSSDARRLLSQLTEAFGVDGMLIVRKSEPGTGGDGGNGNGNGEGDGADLVPGSGLRWPKCRCGRPVCPDYRPDPDGLEGTTGSSVPRGPR
ncbi:hypothetical protein [Streptomyces sp. NPDC006638]|uniref:hypothetical protein n=1 Tax=Streptomyces sp. NPDC006638 TaxID=3157183 RepID=UPI0033A39605